jgi:YidC/Oxa1 family membrane protein insertase
MKSLGWWMLPGLLICLVPVPLEADVSLNTSVLALRFSDQGSLMEASMCFPPCENVESRQQHMEDPDGIISFGQVMDSRWVQRRGVQGGIEEQAVAEIQQLHFSHPGGQSITWLIPSRGYHLEAMTEGAALTLRSGATFQPTPAEGFGRWLERIRYVAVTSGGVRQVRLDSEEVDGFEADWAGFRNRFWTLLVSGPTDSTFEIQTGKENPEAVLQRNKGLPKELLVFYLGPMEVSQLTASDEILDELLFAGLWFWLRWICLGLFHLLAWIQSMVPDWGWAIMFLSVTVHFLMLPLSRTADRVQQRVHATEARLAPELSRIRKDYRGEEQVKKILTLYKEQKIHPLYGLKSLLGVAVVIPVFIGAFDMLAENIGLLGTGFLWIKDLSQPDALFQLPFSLPFFGSTFNLLPFLMTGLSIWAAAEHRPLGSDPDLNKRQVRNMLLLALAFFIVFYTFPAGMVLYWTTNNLAALCKSVWTRRLSARGKVRDVA